MGDVLDGWRAAGNSLRAWRTRTGMSVQGVATALGTARQVIERWESGARRPELLNALELELLSSGKVRVESWGYDARVVDVLRRFVARRGAVAA